MEGMNWANPVDNGNGANKDGLAWPSGMTGSESYEQAYAIGQTVGNAVLKAGGHAVRMPITSALATGVNWWRYGGAINGVASTGVNVILCWWAPSGNTVASLSTWYAMWDTVNSSFGTISAVHYEPINEPYSYSATDLNNLYAGFLARYNPPANKCILDGTGYAQSVVSVGADSRLTSQMLGLHVYSWFFSAPATSGSGASWQGYYNDVANAVGAYAARTVITEIGVQTDGRTPAVPFWQQWDVSMQPDQAVLSGGLAWARNNNVATIAWSGIDDPDLYHWFKAYANLTEANPEVANMFRWAWKEQSAVVAGTYHLQNRSDSYYLDDLGNTSAGSGIGQYSSSSSQNQKWVLTPLDSVWWKLQNVADGNYVDGLGSTTSGSVLAQWSSSSSTNQQWAFEATDSGFYKLINRTTGLCIDTNGQTATGAIMTQTTSGSSYTQQWIPVP
jgi:hypothetical protein